MIAQIRELIAKHGGLARDVGDLSADDDLYGAGLTSFATVQLMLAIEDSFNVEFPDHMLNRRSFSSIGAIEACVAELGGAGSVTA